MIYHVLPELDAFSAFSGLAISRSVANMMRFSDRDIVVCKEADDTWGFPEHRVLVIPALKVVGKIRARQHIPFAISGVYFRHLFKPLLDRLSPGDIVWFHNQPFFAAALGRAVHDKGGLAVYHAQNSTSSGRPAMALIASCCDAHIFISNFLREEMLGVYPKLKNVVTIPNGADERLFFPLPQRLRPSGYAPVILYVGRLQPMKGVHVLTAAMKILTERGINAKCRIVGSSHFGDSKVTAYIDQLVRDAPENVEFREFTIQTKIGDQYRDADILCCPSTWQEPFGNVNIEGMACGLPVVASRVGGIPEIASEGGVILVEPDSPSELAEALQGLIMKAEYRTKISEEGLQAFQRRFTWDKINDQYQRVVRSLEMSAT